MFVFSIKNGGVGATRNILLELFTGDYITFVDNDDWSEKEHVDLLYEQLVKHEADISICNFLSYIEETSVFEYHVDYKRYREENYMPEEWFSYQYKSKDYMSQNASQCRGENIIKALFSKGFLFLKNSRVKMISRLI